MTKHPTERFESAIAIVRRAIALAGRRGDGAGMPKLLERIDVLVAPTGTTSKGSQALIEVVHAAIVGSITTSLAGRLRRRLIDRLRETCGGPFDEDPWACIDPDVLKVREERMRRARMAAASSAVRATDHYTRAGRTQHLRDAVNILEGYREFEARVTGSRLMAANDDAEFARLGDALERSMSPWAWEFFAPCVYREAASTIRASTIRMGPQLKARFDSWFEGAWSVVEPSDPPASPSICFEELVQSTFKAHLAEVRRSRATQAAQEADRRRELEEWEATRRQEEEVAKESEPAGEADAGGSGGMAESHPADEHPGCVQVETDNGLEWVSQAMAAAIKADLAWRGRHDRAMMEEEIRRKQYAERTGRQYEPRYFTRDPF